MRTTKSQSQWNTIMKFEVVIIHNGTPYSAYLYVEWEFLFPQ